MGLFRKEPKIEHVFVEREVYPRSAPKKEKLIQIYTYPQNNTFKGHKSISIYVNDDQKAL